MYKASRRGITVIELVLVIAIVVVIIAILIPRFRHTVPVPGQVAVMQAPDSVVVPGSTTQVAVMLSDSAGHPSVGGRVTFTVARGGGSVTPPAALADSTGWARAMWSVGADTGAKALTVTAPDHPATTVTIATVARPTS